MKTRSSAPRRRTATNRRGGGWLSAGSAILFASVPLGVMLWAIPVTGLGIA